jgi:dienelactone hydrolase
VDEEVCIRALGMSPQQQILIRAATQDDLGRRWSSQAAFRADASGTVDLAAQKPISGTYRDMSPMGLFWSMRLEAQDSNAQMTFAKKDTSPNRVTLEVVVEGRVVASSEILRNFQAAETQTRDLEMGTDILPGGQDTGNRPPIIGRLFIPPGRGPHPAVVVLSGTGGGFDLDKAAVLSRQGFATLALAYFGIPPLPTWLHRIPLEYFEAALGWLAAQPEIDAQRIGVLGVSRGAELALLLGAKFPAIHPVAAYAPSNVAWAAGGRDKATGEIIPSWTWQGSPVPFAPLPLRGFMWRSAIPVAALRRRVMFRNLFRAGLRNREAIERASIAVERIGGPLLLISGGDDHLWPATEMSQAILARLKKNGFAHSVEHLNYPRAGHMLRYPYLPTTSRESGNTHLRGAKFSFGGTPQADAEAQTDAWRRAIAFFKSSL